MTLMDIKTWYHKIIEWVISLMPTRRDILCVLIGVTITAWVALNLHIWRISEGAELGAMIIKGTKYNVVISGK